MYFKFKNIWLKFAGFVEQVHSWWMSYGFHGLPGYVLASKLKGLKADLKIWNEEVFGDIGKKKKELLKGIRDLDLIAEDRGLVYEERMRQVENFPFCGSELETKLKISMVEGGGQQY
jgi:hypothetical protein